MKSKFLLAAIFLLLGLRGYAVTPTITAFSPQSGAVGTLITITGSNLAGTTTVSVGGVSGLVVSKSGPQLVAYVMPGSVTGAISIATPGGTANSGGSFTVTPTPFPTVQEGNPIIPTATYNYETLGSAVAISADGGTAIIGGYSFDGFTPSIALVFTYSNGAWVQQGVLTDPTMPAGQGRSVALSADGNTAMIGGSSYTPNPGGSSTGGIWFYTRTGSTWTQQGPIMVGTGGTGSSQGVTCTLSADGNTAIEGDISDNNYVGATWAFTRNAAGVWSQQGAKFSPSDNAGSAEFGSAIALSADGNTVVIGGSTDGINVIGNQEFVPGATWVFTRAGSTWKQQGSKLLAAGATGDDGQGRAVAISANGNLLTTSGPQSSSVWVFTRTGGAWSQLGGRLAETGVTGSSNQGFGTGVSMSADGNTIMVGDGQNGSFDNPGPGGTWVFARSGNIYIQEESALFGAGTGATANPEQGATVALSANGTVGITGGPNNGSSFQGAAWAFSAALQTQTITFAALANAQYGSANVNPGATSDNSTISITYTSSDPTVATITPAGAIHIIGAGTTGITASQSGSSVYSPATTVTQPFTVTPAPLTITADNKSKAVGTANPPLTATITGFVNGDTQASLTQQPTVTTTATTTSPAGIYLLTPASAVDPNYTFTYVDGTLKVISNVHNALLNSIALSPDLPLTVVAGPGYKNYTATATTPTISLTAVTVDPMATFTVNGVTATSGSPFGPIALNPGDNTITIVVTAEDGTTTNTYIITVTRTLSNNDLLTSIGLTPNTTLTPIAGPGFKNYSATVGNTTTSVTETAITADPAANFTVDGNTATSGTPYGPISLNVGSNTITTIVTAEDGSTNSYIITVFRKASSIATLSALRISNGTLTPVFASGTGNYTASVANSTGSITLTPTLTDITASVTVNGFTTMSGDPSVGIGLSVGPNTINILVTAQDGTTNNYKVMVTRAPSSNALLSSIGLHPFEPLTTVAGPGYKNYTATVGNSVTSTSVVPTASDPFATITVNGTTVFSGDPSGPIMLNVGSTTINTIVTAQDGTMKTYIITVTRSGPVNIPDVAIGVEQAVNSPQFGEDGIVVRQGLSPNGDGVNDFLTIDGIAAYPDNKITIMSRNGALVFEAKGYDNSTKVFDGHSNKTGVMQLPGTYFYSLDYAVKGVTKHKTGFIVLKY